MPTASLCFAYLGILSEEALKTLRNQGKAPVTLSKKKKKKTIVEVHNEHIAWKENIGSENLGE